MAGAPVGTLGTIPTITVGGHLFSDLTNLIIAAGKLASNNHYTETRKSSSTSAYQVTTGKTLSIGAVENLIDTAAAGTQALILLYGDNAVGLDTATVPTTPVYVSGSVTISSLCWAASTTGVFSAASNFQVPALKYPSFNHAFNGSSNPRLYGYEA